MDLSAANLAPMISNWRCVSRYALLNLSSFAGLLATTRMSSASTRGTTSMYRMTSSHGLVRTATNIIEKGHSWGVEVGLLYGCPKPPATTFRTVKSSRNLR